MTKSVGMGKPAIAMIGMIMDEVFMFSLLSDSYCVLANARQSIPLIITIAQSTRLNRDA